ncbi:MAG: SBBP repeat-containing protein [Flavobacteriales bacterium]
MLDPRTLVLMTITFSAAIVGSAQSFEWAAIARGAFSRGFASVTDASGNVYVCGNVNGETDFDPGPGVVPLGSDGANGDIFLVKYDPDGAYVWHIAVGGSGTEIPSDLCLDHNGGLLMTGRTQSFFDWDTGPDTTRFVPLGSYDGFLAKYDTSGQFHWVRQLGGTLTDESTGVAVDVDDNVYVTGYYGATLQLGPAPFSATLSFEGGVQDSYIVKYSAAGEFIWVRGLQGEGAQTAQAIACDDAGYLYTAGQFFGATALGPASTGVITGAGGEGFLCKHTVDGDFVWAKAFGGPLNEKTDVVLADGAGHLYLFGRFGSTADLDPGPGASVNTAVGAEYNAFYSKLDTSGQAIWVRTLHANTIESGTGDLAYDGSGNVFVIGNFNVAIDLDPGTGTTIAEPLYPNDHFIVKFDSTGAFRWGQTIITDDVFGTVDGLSTDPEGNVFVSGSFSTSIAFDDSGAEGSFFTDIMSAGYVAKYGGDLITALPSAIEPAFRIEVYPDPATDRITVRSMVDRPLDRVEIVDGNGRVVWLSNNPEATTVPVHLFAPGIYTVAVRSGGEWATTRFTRIH